MARRTLAAVYMLTSRKRTVLYVGVTSDLAARMAQHRAGTFPGFTRRYGVQYLVWYEWHEDIRQAIAREKQLKGWTRLKKIQLIVSMNPTWKDLAEGWYPELKRTERSTTWVLRLGAWGAALRMTKHKIHPALRGTQVFAG